MKPFIHESSYVETKDIGWNTKIWHFCHIEEDVKIGEGCMIGQGCYIGNGVTIGDGCRIQNHNSIWSGINLENFVFVGPNVVFTNVIKPEASLKQPYMGTIVKEGASIGAGAHIRCGITIGEGAIIGMGSTILYDVKPNTTVVGLQRVL